MSPLFTSLIVFACVFGGALLGIFLDLCLPEHHLASDTKDAVRLAMGLVVTTVALGLGLLIGSAKSFFDTQNTEIAQLAANSVLFRQAYSTGLQGMHVNTSSRQTPDMAVGSDLT